MESETLAGQSSEDWQGRACSWCISLADRWLCSVSLFQATYFESFVVKVAEIHPDHFLLIWLPL